MDFTQQIFSAFLAGRTAITNQGSVAEISAYRQTAAEGMEKVIAATVVHYINDTLSDMSKLGTGEENIANFKQTLGRDEGVHGRVAVQSFPVDYRWTTCGITWYHGESTHVYDEPGSNAYTTQVNNYTRAKAVMQAAYGFSNANMENW